MQLVSGLSGIATSQVSSGRTTTHHMIPVVRNSLFFCWAMIARHQLRHATCRKPQPKWVVSVEDYRKELVTSLTSARELEAQSIQKAQERYKRHYDRRVTYTTTLMRVGDWVLVHMPHEETGPQRKLSRP